MKSNDKKPSTITKRILIFILTVIALMISACMESPSGGSISSDGPAQTGEYVEIICHHGTVFTLPIYETRIFDADYIEIYADTLNTMFDYEWTLLLEEVIYEEWCYEELNFLLMCHLDDGGLGIIRSNQFIEWTIEYRDGNDDIRHFVFRNIGDVTFDNIRWGFSNQVQRHVSEYIAEYYRKHFFDVYLRDIPIYTDRPDSAIVSVNFVWLFGDGYSNATDEMVYEMMGKIANYRRSLATPEGAIRFSQLTPANVFEMAPVDISISISLLEYLGSDQQEFEEYVFSQVGNMIESMKSFTNNNINVRVNMHFRGQGVNFYDGSGQVRWHYLQGERIFIDGRDFSWYVAERYQGVFW